MNQPRSGAVVQYGLVFLALVALTGATTAIAYTDLGRANLPIALSIASTKALLVLLFFMHVRFERPLIWAIFAAGVLWLAILIGLTMLEITSRGDRGLVGARPAPVSVHRASQEAQGRARAERHWTPVRS